MFMVFAEILMNKYRVNAHINYRTKCNINEINTTRETQWEILWKSSHDSNSKEPSLNLNVFKL